VKCLEGERHDVSKDDIIEFHGDQSVDRGTKVLFPKCQVTSVKSPTCFIVKCVGAALENQDKESESITDSPSSMMASLLEGRARSFARMKLPKQIAFSSLREIIRPNDIDGSHRWNDETFFAPSDLDKSFDPIRRRAIMSSMLALDEFVKKYGQLPSNSRRGENNNYKQRKDSERLQSLVHKITKIDDESSANVQKLVIQFAQTCRAKFVPVQAVAGALGAQEALKAATGLYNPIRQFLLYDCDEVLQSAEEEIEEARSDSVAAPGLAYILGEPTSNKLARSRIFVVGAGAIGCELSKNLAAMGAGTGIGSTRRGSIILTDMDTIEKSNLSRQLLFRDHDVGEFKSVAARAAVMRFNHKVHVEAYTNRVGDDERFNDTFWSYGCHAVMNALDNVEARLFVDHKCVTHGLGLIDAGTLGPKGNVQVVIPQKSESYGSSADPPEPDIPVCTLKNFPYDISHTIQWARDLFDGYFNRRPRQANDHVGEMPQIDDLHALGQSMIDKLGDDAAIAMAKELGEDLGPFPFIVGADSHDPEYVAVVRKLSLDWAMKQANELFYVTMAELIQKHPLDSVDDDGLPFWSGTRRAPKPMRFMPLDSDVQVSAQQVIINESIAQFVSSAARLRMESFLQKSSVTSVTLEEALYALQEEAKILEKKKKKVETVLHNLSGGGSGRDRDTLSLILERLNAAKIGTSFQPYLFPADFEKDDESNGHVAFITAASNLRAMAYGIPPADAMETRRVAGKIVPAMITTTGLVSALSCIELVKLLRGLPLTKHRNAFVNLALPFFAFTAPMPADKVLGVNGKKHTLWDRLVCHGEFSMTLKMFLEKILDLADCTDNFEVSSITYGPYMIFANFLHSQDQELLNTPLLNLVKDAIISEVDDNVDESDADLSQERIIHPSVEQKAMLSRLDQKRFIDFSVAVENKETGEEFELPNVRLIKENLRQDPEVLTQEESTE
jgi:ubiquitin-activating enzyme E1